MKKYGFLGLGIMGTAMAINLLKSGNKVVVWNRTNEKCLPLVDHGASRGTNPAEVIAQCDITFAMVSDPAAAQALCFDRGGVLESITTGKAYIDVSTVDPAVSINISTAITEKGGRFLEAPVSGSKKPAEDGTLIFLCAGDESLYHEAGPALQVMGKKSFYFGEVGRAAQMKLVVNMIMGIMMVGFGEGLALGDKAGLDMNNILEVLAEGAINNPMFQLKGPQILANTFHPAFPLKHMQKDMRLALQLGDQYSQPLYSAGAANATYIKAGEAGCGDEDFSAVFKAIKK
ncbi:MAG: NAD(P)-dependent oxidoreductase [Desulforhopalus sp.]